MTEMTGTEQVNLPATLVSRVRERVEVTEFESVEEYVEYVLEEVLWQVESASSDATEPAGEIDETVVEERLESLGYLNE